MVKEINKFSFKDYPFKLDFFKIFFNLNKFFFHYFFIKNNLQSNYFTLKSYNEF